MSENADRANPKPPSVDRLSLLWRRINDHKMVQWSVAYVALAYGVQHGVTLTSEAFEWPHAVERVSMLLLVLGLPVVMTLAWYHGARASRRISGPELTIISILLAIGSLFFYVVVRPSDQIAAGTAAREAGIVSGAPSPAQSGGISVAVLPFVNLSSDKEQEFFSDGMTDEITSALAKVRDLRMVGRSSAFQFKGQNKDLRAIGQALSARYLIDGSVRKAGDRVRITAQLIEAGNGVQLWSENYDRELKDVFAVQEDIAQAIAASLRVPLGLKQGESLIPNRTTDTDSYQDYLRARALVRGRGALEPGGPLTEAAKLLEQVVARDSHYASAWGLLAQAYAYIPVNTAAFVNGSTDEFRRIAAASLQNAEAAAQQAIRLDPNNIDGYSGLGLAREFAGKFIQAEDLYKQALSRDPGSPDTLHRYSLVLAIVGRLKDSLALRLRLRAQEPFVPIFNQYTAIVLWLNGRNDEAIAIFKALPRTFFFPGFFLSQVYASTGRFSEAADSLREIPSGGIPPGALTEAVGLLSKAPAQTAPSQTSLSKGLLGFVYLYAGAPDRALDLYEGLAEAGEPAIAGVATLLWAPAYAPVRKTDRFKIYARKAGLVDYWKARGWPDLCHPVGADDFACE